MPRKYSDKTLKILFGLSGNQCAHPDCTTDLITQDDENSGSHIDFRPVLKGELFGPLQNRELFDKVVVDQEVHTLVWPNGADFDPNTLYHWPDRGPRFAELAATWMAEAASTARTSS